MAGKALKVFTCDDHDGVWLGGASVVVAASEDDARRLLAAELQSRNLRTERMTLRQLDLRSASVNVLWDGNY